MKHTIFLFFFFLFTQILSAQYGVETDPLTGKKGLVDPIDGRKILPFEFDDVQPWSGDTLVTVTKGKLRGLYGEKSGRLIIPVVYDEIDVSWQAGSKLGYAGVKKGGKTGLFNLKGKLVLPIQYEYVRAVFADLLVARLAGDTVLQFFDVAGKPVFKTPGNTAWPGFDDNTTEIIRADKSRYFLSKQGKTVFPENITHGRWTDGNMVMCATVTPGKIINFGLLSWAGDTILDCSYNGIIPVASNRFLVKKGANIMGLVNEQGAFLIPFEAGYLLPEGNVLVRRYEGKHFGCIVYDTDGTKLLENVSFELLQRDYNAPTRFFESNQNKFYLASKDNAQTTGIFHADGRMILPMQFKYIQYASEKHALLAFSDGAYTVWQIDGKQAVPGRFKHLFFSIDPNVLYGVPEGGEKWGFINLDEPNETQFLYDLISLNDNSNCFSVLVNMQYFLHDTSGKRINNEAFVYMGAPGREHHEAWRKAGKKGKLVAQGSRVQDYNGSWVGFDEKGKAFEFKAIEEDPMIEEAPPMIEEVIKGRN